MFHSIYHLNDFNFSLLKTIYLKKNVFKIESETNFRSSRVT